MSLRGLFAMGALVSDPQQPGGDAAGGAGHRPAVRADEATALTKRWSGAAKQPEGSLAQPKARFLAVGISRGVI